MPVETTETGLRVCRLNGEYVEGLTLLHLIHELVRIDMQAQRRISALEALRPQWAQGYTSDSIAAQSSSAALSSIWALLGASNQTECMIKLRELTGEQNESQS